MAMEIDDPLSRPGAPAGAWWEGLTPRHWRILWGAYLGWIFDGYEAVALVYALPPALKALLTPEQAQATAGYQGAAIGITLLGWGIGGMLGGIAADYVGRKRMMLVSILGYALLTGLTAFAGSFAALAALRFVTGLALGSEWSTGIALVAETWPNRARPKGCGFLQSGFGCGALLAALAWLLIPADGIAGVAFWRILFLLGALPALVFLYLRGAMEESERWLDAVREHRWAATEGGGGAPAARATAVSDQLESPSRFRPDETALDSKLERIRRRRKRSRRPFSLVEVFREPESRRRVLLATALSFATTVGWWAISSWLPAYTAGLAKAAGESPATWGPRIGVVYNVGAVTAYLVAGFVADAVGRRLFLVMTYAGCIVASVLTYTWTGSLGTFGVLAFVDGFFTLGFAYSWMAIYLAELFTSPVRATASSFVFNGARMVAWVFPVIAGQIVGEFGGVSHAALIMSSVFAIGLVVPWFMPETTGRPLPA